MRRFDRACYSVPRRNITLLTNAVGSERPPDGPAPPPPPSAENDRTYGSARGVEVRMDEESRLITQTRRRRTGTITAQC